MKTTMFLKAIFGIAVAVSLTLAAVHVPVSGQDTKVGEVLEPLARHGQAGALEGTWLNEVKIVRCPPAEPEVIASLQSMTTFMRGGILIEGGGPATPPPAVSRSAGHGIWERTGDDTFRVFFRYHSFDNLGRLVRISEVTTHPTLFEGELSGEGTNRITNINPVDGTVISVAEGCNEATSRRVLFEN